jgi:phosphatidylserine decarboxylase
MNLAKGSKPWIYSAFFAGIIFLILFIIFIDRFIGIIFLFLSTIVFLKAIFLIQFFRDPDRVIGEGIVACADGKVREISSLNDDKVGNCTKISTFMNIYNVHVNRIPFDGTVQDIIHIQGIHLPAFKKESEKNERVVTTIDTKIGTIKVIQIAGTIARRIVPYIKKGDKLKKGDRIGIIRFGSRVDIYLPTEKIRNIHVKVGDIIKAGETTIAEIND